MLGTAACLLLVPAPESVGSGFPPLQLTLLAPDIVEAMLEVPRPEGPGLPRLMEPLQVEWDEQRMALFPGRCRGACPMAGWKAGSAT
jgi:hypothetical protein